MSVPTHSSWPSLFTQALNEQKAELTAKVHTLKKELADWRSKLDTQVKTYREVSSGSSTSSGALDTYKELHTGTPPPPHTTHAMTTSLAPYHSTQSPLQEITDLRHTLNGEVEVSSHILGRACLLLYTHNPTHRLQPLMRARPLSPFGRPCAPTSLTSARR